MDACWKMFLYCKIKIKLILLVGFCFFFFLSNMEKQLSTDVVTFRHKIHS